MFGLEGQFVAIHKACNPILAVSPRTPNLTANAPNKIPTKTSIARYFVGTLPMNIIQHTSQEEKDCR
jgi:hypothetical protein